MSDRLSRFLFYAILFLAACFANDAFGQGGVVAGNPVVINGVGQPMAGVTVAVCNTNPGASPSVLCSGSNLAVLYTDITLATPCSGTLQGLNNQFNPLVGSGCSNPGLTDGLGNVVAFTTAGPYWCEYTGSNLIGIQVGICPFPSPTGGGGGGTNTFYQEIPAGAINGSNPNFTLSQTPASAASVDCFENGLQQLQGAGFDYVVSGTSLTWQVPPLSGYRLNCQYLVAGSSASFNQGPPSGAINGTNPTFVLSPAPTSSANVNCFENGLQQLQGSGNDYTISGATLTWQVPPLSGYRLNCLWF